VISLTGKPSGLHAGGYANVTMITAESSGVSVPTSAVHHSGRFTTVTVYTRGTTHLTRVTVGTMGPVMTRITSGLKADQHVVLPTLGKPIPTNNLTNRFPGPPGGPSLEAARAGSSSHRDTTMLCGSGRAAVLKDVTVITEVHAMLASAGPATRGSPTTYVRYRGHGNNRANAIAPVTHSGAWPPGAGIPAHEPPAGRTELRSVPSLRHRHDAPVRAM
jgi:hypothetical protein